MLALNDNKRQDRLASSINALDYRCLLAIAKLLRICFAISLGAYDNYCGWDNAYLKPSLVEVVGICLLDIVPCNYILHKCKPTANNL